MVHARGDVKRCGNEILHLLGSIPVLLQEQGQSDHRVEIAAGVGGDEIGHEVLLLARLIRCGLESPGERLEVLD